MAEGVNGGPSVPSDDPRRLRLDAGDLTTLHFERFPVWAFLLDEEGAGGRDECTVGPLHPVGWSGEFSRIVGTVVTFADGRSVAGAVSVNSFDLAERTPAAELDQWLLPPDATRVDLTLPPEGLVPTGEQRRAVDAAYELLRTSAPSMFPLTVRPRVPVPGLPAAWVLAGFRRPVRLDGEERTLK